MKTTARISFKDDTGHVDEWRDCEFIPSTGDIVRIGTPKKSWRIIALIWSGKYEVEAVVWPEKPFHYMRLVENYERNR